jgi:quinol monooxygenase YgiN
MRDVFVFVTLHAASGHDEALASATRQIVAQTREEPGCLFVEGFRSCQDLALFYIHSRWIDDAALDAHQALPHTSQFVGSAQTLLDRPMQVVRTRPI